MAIVYKDDRWAKLEPSLITQITEQFNQFSATQVRAFLLSLALETSANTDDCIVFMPLAYLVGQQPVAIPKQSSIQTTSQEFLIDKKIEVNGKGITFEKAMMFNQMGILGNYDVGYEDNLEYIADFSKALQILLSKNALTAEDFINIVHYLLWVWETRFHRKDFYPEIVSRINQFLQPSEYNNLWIILTKNR